MNCPKCETALVTKQVANVELDECPACNGIWFDLGELKTVLADEENFAFGTATGSSNILNELTGPCPRCGGKGHMTRLTNLNRPDVMMDSCPVCYGIWLDGGEIEQMAAKGLTQNLRSLVHNLFGV